MLCAEINFEKLFLRNSLIKFINNNNYYIPHKIMSIIIRKFVTFILKSAYCKFPNLRLGKNAFNLYE